MKKLLLSTLLVVGLLFGFSGLAKAEIFVNFDDPSLWVDGSTYGSDYIYGNTYTYVYNTSHGFIGMVDINGDASISNTIMAGDVHNTYPDHTTGSGSFLSGSDVLLDFTNLDTNVNSFDLYSLGQPGVGMFGTAYDWNGNGFTSNGGNPIYGDGTWHPIGPVSLENGPVSAIEFNTDGGYYDNNGNLIDGMAIDDLTLHLASDTVVPEPASIFLLGFGLLMLIIVGRKIKFVRAAL